MGRSGLAARSAVFALAALLIGCIPYEGNKAGRRFMVTGDSITVLATQAITDRILDEHRATIRAQAGQTILDMLDEAQAQAANGAGRPEAAIVNLGTNDVMQDNADWRQHFDQLVDVLDEVPCVNLVTVNELHVMPNVDGGDINDAIDEVVQEHPGQFHRVEWNIDWTGEMGELPPDDPGPHYYSIYVEPGVYAGLPNGGWIGDGIHQSPEGSVELARRYEEALEVNCGFE